jgi:hypothetical protein
MTKCIVGENSRKGSVAPFASLRCADFPLAGSGFVDGALIRILMDVVEVWDRMLGGKVGDNGLAILQFRGELIC